MIDILNFVSKAVCKADYPAVRRHFKLSNGTISAYDGEIAISCAIDCDINAQPEAATFLSAMSKCDKDITSLALTKTGKINIKSGSFKAFIKCTTDDLIIPEPSGHFVDLDDQFITTIKTLSNFISSDPNQKWANSLLIDKDKAYTTNNRVALQHDLRCSLEKPIVIPKKCVDTLVKINKAPVKMQVSASSVTFYYSPTEWLSSNLLDVKWPDLEPTINQQCAYNAISSTLFDELGTLSGFTDKLDKVHIGYGFARTSLVDQDGAAIAIQEQSVGCYKLHDLLSVKDIMTHADFTQYPKPLLFKGDKLKGALAVRVQ